jgi:hypothetical protein
MPKGTPLSSSPPCRHLGVVEALLPMVDLRMHDLRELAPVRDQSFALGERW